MGEEGCRSVRPVGGAYRGSAPRRAGRIVTWRCRRRRLARSSTMSGGSGRPTATFPLPRCDTAGQDEAILALASPGTTVVAFGDLARVKGRTQFSMAHHLPCGELACGGALWRSLQLIRFDGVPGGCCRCVVAAPAGVSMRDAPTVAERAMHAGGPAMGIPGLATVVADECHLGKLSIGCRSCPQSCVSPSRPGTLFQVLGFRRADRELLRLRRTGRRPRYIQYETVRRACPVHAPGAEWAARREDEGTVRARLRSLQHRSVAGVARPALRLCSVAPAALNGSQPMNPGVTSRDVALSLRSINGCHISSRDGEGTVGEARIDGPTSGSASEALCLQLADERAVGRGALDASGWGHECHGFTGEDLKAANLSGH